MAYGSEAKATLGVDTSHVPEDMAKARQAFNKGAEEIARDSAHHGGKAGEEFVKNIEHKLLGARHLSNALATALGLNIESISEKITAAIVGGTKEGWKQAGEVTAENARLIGAIIEARLTPKQLEQSHQQELSKAIRESGSEGGNGSDASATAAASVIGQQIGGGSGFLKQFFALLGWGTTQAEKLKDTEEKTHAVLEAQAKVEEDKRRTREQLKELDDQTLSAAEKQGTLQERNDKILDHVKRLQDEIAKGGLTEVEIAKKKLEIEQKFTEVQAIQKEMREKAQAAEKTAVELAQKRLELDTKRQELKKDEAKLTDRTKLTVGELAELKAAPNQSIAEDDERRRRAFAYGENDGLSSAQVDAKERARKVQDIEKKAEQARQSGDSDKASDMLREAGQLRESLVKWGFTKSTEGDAAATIAAQIAQDNKAVAQILKEIKTIEAGKYVNQ